MNSLVVPLVLFAAPAFVALRGFREEYPDIEISWPLFALILLYPGLVLGYAGLWIYSRRSHRDIELRAEEIWLPPSGIATFGKAVPYSLITSVDLTSRGRRLKIRWNGGSKTYGREAFTAQLGSVQGQILKRIRQGRSEA